MRIVAALLLVVGLVSCTTTGARQYQLSDLMFIDANGELHRYLNLIGEPHQTQGGARALPVTRMWIGAIPNDVKWMLAYNFDNNDVLDKAEMTHAWLVKAVDVAFGRSYPSDSLVVYPQVASLLAQTPNVNRIKGIHISNSESMYVRGAMEHGQGDFRRQRVVKAMLDVMDKATASSLDSGSGGGGGDGGGD